ncbi:glycosyltransferase family 2 protein [Flavobacterium myungsuense]|uniref:Glycosyltransferase family 2 protein n=1 Tax=Flavobacterium myungsuense TaxID=651823 RepID=A0ABW3IZD9_9FLAO
MKPLLSIITINLNDVNGLKKTINSVVNQTFQDFEYIIIDGGSSDKSIELIQNNNERINYWVSEKDSGIFNAMNKGIKVANGTYLLFLNSGDVLNGSSALQDFISSPDFEGDIIYGDYKFDRGGKVYPDVLTPLFFIKSSLPHQSTFFKSHVFDEMGYYDERYKIVADRAFYIKCFLSNLFVFKHVNYFLTVFNMSGISNDSIYTFKKNEEDNTVFKEYYGVFYDDFKAMISLQHQLNQAKRETVKGIFSRILNKIKLICRNR